MEAVCFPTSLISGARVAEEALREVFYRKHKGKIEAVIGKRWVLIKSPITGNVVADVCMVDVAGDLWCSVSLTELAPFRSRKEAEVFNDVVTRIAKEQMNYISA